MQHSLTSLIGLAHSLRAADCLREALFWPLFWLLFQIPPQTLACFHKRLVSAARDLLQETSLSHFSSALLVGRRRRAAAKNKQETNYPNVDAISAVCFSSRFVRNKLPDSTRRVAPKGSKSGPKCFKIGLQKSGPKGAAADELWPATSVCGFAPKSRRETFSQRAFFLFGVNSARLILRPQTRIAAPRHSCRVAKRRG